MAGEAELSSVAPLLAASAPGRQPDHLLALEEATWLDRQLRHTLLKAQISSLEQQERRRNSVVRHASWQKAAALMLAGCAPVAALMQLPLPWLGSVALTFLMATVVRAGSREATVALSQAAREASAVNSQL